MTSATASRTARRPAVERPPTVPREAEGATREKTAAAAGTMVAEAEEFDRLYVTVLCCSLDLESK